MKVLNDVEFVTYPRSGVVYKILPNYNKNGERGKDFNEIYFFNFGEKIIFDDFDEPIPDNLKMDLYQYGYLNKLTACYVAEYNFNYKKPVLKIILLSYKMLKKLSYDISFYYDIIEYPRIRIIKEDDEYLFFNENETEFNIDESIDVESLYNFESDEEIIEFVKNKEISIEEKIKESSWINMKNEIEQLLEHDIRLNRHKNIFRIRKIDKIINEK